MFVFDAHDLFGCEAISYQCIKFLYTRRSLETYVILLSVSSALFFMYMQKLKTSKLKAKPSTPEMKMSYICEKSMFRW